MKVDVYLKLPEDAPVRELLREAIRKTGALKLYREAPDGC